MAPRILQHLPEHRVYVEPFAGAASVLLRKAPAPLEVLSDLNGRLVNVFEVPRDPARAAALIEGLRLTPYAEREYRGCRQPAEDLVENVRRLLVLGHQGHGSTAATEGKRSGWRRGDRGTQANSAREWQALWQQVHGWADRLRGVYLEQVDALQVIGRWDQPEALFYVDPPYVAATRTTGCGAYGHEYTDDDHRRLAAYLRSVKGMVVLSGYPSGLYDKLYGDWVCVRFETTADAAARRTEALWLNPAAAERQRQIDLFGYDHRHDGEGNR